MTPAPNGWEVGGVVGGVLSGLTVLGGAIAWLANWSDRRAARIEAVRIERERRLSDDENELDARWKNYRILIEQRLSESDETVKRQGDAIKKHNEQMTALRFAFEIVAGELRTRDPENSALKRAEQLLSLAFPLSVIAPPEIASAMAKLEQLP